VLCTESRSESSSKRSRPIFLIVAADASATIEREAADFDFPSVEHAAQRYAEDFGPFVIARGVLEPQDRWAEFLQAFADLIRRFNLANDGTAKIRSDYFVIRVER
jgi:hypothetical protein